MVTPANQMSPSAPNQRFISWRSGHETHQYLGFDALRMFGVGGMGAADECAALQQTSHFRPSPLDWNPKQERYCNSLERRHGNGRTPPHQGLGPWHIPRGYLG